MKGRAGREDGGKILHQHAVGIAQRQVLAIPVQLEVRVQIAAGGAHVGVQPVAENDEVAAGRDHRPRGEKPFVRGAGVVGEPPAGEGDVARAVVVEFDPVVRVVGPLGRVLGAGLVRRHGLGGADEVFPCLVVRREDDAGCGPQVGFEVNVGVVDGDVVDLDGEHVEPLLEQPRRRVDGVVCLRAGVVAGGVGHGACRGESVRDHHAGRDVADIGPRDFHAIDVGDECVVVIHQELHRRRIGRLGRGHIEDGPQVEGRRQIDDARHERAHARGGACADRPRPGTPCRVIVASLRAPRDVQLLGEDERLVVKAARSLDDAGQVLPGVRCGHEHRRAGDAQARAHEEGGVVEVDVERLDGDHIGPRDEPAVCRAEIDRLGVKGGRRAGVEIRGVGGLVVIVKLLRGPGPAPRHLHAVQVADEAVIVIHRELHLVRPRRVARGDGEAFPQVKPRREILHLRGRVRAVSRPAGDRAVAKGRRPGLPRGVIESRRLPRRAGADLGRAGRVPLEQALRCGGDDLIDDDVRTQRHGEGEEREHAAGEKRGNCFHAASLTRLPDRNEAGTGRRTPSLLPRLPEFRSPASGR